MILPATVVVDVDLTATKTLYVIARGVDYFGMTLFVGGLFFLAVLWPQGGEIRRARGVVTTGWVLGFVGTVAAIGLQAAWVADAPPSAMFDPELIGRLLDVQFGRVWFAKSLLWVLAGVVLAGLLQGGQRAAQSLAWRVGAGVVSIGLIRTTGLTGHAVDSDLPLVSQIAGFLHLVGVCLWIGGLAVLLFGVLSRRRPDELARVVPNYSKLAMGAMAFIVGAGVVLAVQTVGSLDALTSTSYGQILLVKLATIATVLLIAQSSRGWIARRLEFAVVLRGEASVVRPFVYSVAAETALVVTVLLAASFLVTASPGR